MAVTLMLAAALAATPLAQEACAQRLGAVDGLSEDTSLPNEVDGSTISGREQLVALRVARGDAVITVKGGNFARADLRGATLHNICFVETDLSGSDWRGAQAEGVGFVRANLAGANLAGANLRRLLIREADLANVDATGADLSGGRLDGGWDGSMENLRLVRANLEDFNFACGITISDGCPLNGAIDLSGADLSRAHLALYDRITSWTGARIDETEVAFTQLADLASAEIVGPIHLEGGGSTVALSREEHRALLPHLRGRDEAPSPSFDCAAASTPVERLICGAEGGTLRKLDRDVDALYRRVLARDPGEARAQGSWLRARNGCHNGDDTAAYGCLNQRYEERKQGLVARLGPAAPPPGEVHFYVEAPVEFDDGFRDDPLYRRLVPALIHASWSRASVRTNADGTIDVRGDAIGGNAHSCSLGGDRLRFDPATGWYSGPFRATGAEPAGWRDRPMPVLLLWGERAEVYLRGRGTFGATEGDPRASDYASCGARAGFGEMIRMPVPRAEAQRRFDAYDDPEQPD